MRKASQHAQTIVSMLTPLYYSFDDTQRVNWTTTQEKSLTSDFPFELEQENNEQYVVRTYLQFLWFPESIMPLKLLIPSLLRVHYDPSSSGDPHSLHALLKPLLQTARSASNKYHVELPQILIHGGGAGEIEETTMWYALNYEQADDELWARTSAAGQGPWIDEKWRTAWIERMERREFQIQILLYFLKLSLPGPPMPPDSPPRRKKGSRNGSHPAASSPSDEDRLESFMDKLSMWQLMADLEQSSVRSTSASNNKGERDWMQIFAEEIVEPQFKSKLPDKCALLRSKVFPNSPLPPTSRSPSPPSSRAGSPEVPLAFKRSKSSTRQPSPALSILSASTGSKSRTLERTRSRSLSLSLAQERERERERSVGLAVTKKRVLNREVSMSRVFKPKSKMPEANVTSKRKKPDEENPSPKAKDEGVTLVADTPVKMKARVKTKHGIESHSQSLNGGQTLKKTEMFSLPSLVGAVQHDDDGDEEWRLSSSPDILLLGGKGSDGDDDLWVSSTPSKSKRPRVR